MSDLKVGDRVRHWNLVDGNPYEGTVVRVDDDPDYPVVVEWADLKVRMRYRRDELEEASE